jgi:transposase
MRYAASTARVAALCTTGVSGNHAADEPSPRSAGASPQARRWRALRGERPRPPGRSPRRPLKNPVSSGLLGTLPSMLSTTTGQVGFFDAAELIGPLPEGSFFALLAEHGERIVRDEDFADCYSDGVGRPSIPPSQLAKVLLLQYRIGCSDERAMESVAWDLRWKIALGLPVDHTGWSPSTLTRYRARLLLHGRERLVLENTLSLAEELGLLDAPAEQIVDSTPMLGAAATQDTVRLVRSGVKKLLEAVEAVDEEAARRLDDGLEFDYARPSEKPDCRWREKAERERMLTRVAEDAERALRAVERADGLLGDGAVGEAHGLLRELVGQDFDVDEDGVPRLHRGTRRDRILSVHDAEMRHGRKSQHQRFDGYKVHAAAANAETPLITAVGVGPANEQDGPQARAWSIPSPRRAGPSGCLATPPTAPGRSAPSSRNARLTCSRRCPSGQPRAAGSASTSSTSILRRGRSLARPARSRGSGPSPPAGGGRVSRRRPATVARCGRAVSRRPADAGRSRSSLTRNS